MPLQDFMMTEFSLKNKMGKKVNLLPAHPSSNRAICACEQLRAAEENGSPAFKALSNASLNLSSVPNLICARTFWKVGCTS